MHRVALIGTVVLAAALGAWWGLRTTEPGHPDADPATERAARREKAAEVLGVPAPAPATSLTGRGAPSEPARPRTPRVLGRVVDPSGRPLAGAAVECITAQARASATTDSDGRFVLEAPVWGTGLAVPGRVEARRGDLAGMHPLFFTPTGPGVPPADHDVGDLPLAAAADLVVEVERSCGRGPPAEVLLYEALLAAEPLVARGKVAEDGRVTFAALPAGRYRAIAAAAGCGRATAITAVPRPSGDPLPLALGEERIVTVTVVDAATEAGIPGAVVRVAESYRDGDAYRTGPAGTLPAEVRTDAQGAVVLRGLGAEDRLDLDASAEGYPAPSSRRGDGPWHARVPRGATEARLVLAKPRTIRWPLKPGAAGPADGSLVRLTPHTNSGILEVPPEGRMEGEDLVVEGWGAGHAAAYAHAPDGTIARLQAPADKGQGYPIEFFPRRRIVVTLREEGGGPVAGWSVQPFDQGNNPVVAPRTTDAEGSVRFEDLYGGPGNLVDLQGGPPGVPPFAGGYALGTVDLARQDGAIECVIPAERRVAVRFLLGGRPFLPHARVTANGRAVLLESRDEATEEVRFAWRPVPGETSLRVSVHEAGYRVLPAEPVPLGRPGDLLAVRLDLEPFAALRVRVRLPADGEHRVVLDRFDPATGGWPAGSLANAGRDVRGRRAEADGTLTYRELEPGRYRAVDAGSGAVSAEVAVVAGGEPPEVLLDLSASGWATGRVLPPEGREPEPVGIVFDGERPRLPEHLLLPGTHRSSVWSAKDGTFRVRVPGHRPVHLRGVHGSWIPAAEGGVVEVLAPRDGIVLRMADGPTARVAFATPPLVMMNPGQARPVPVLLYAGEPEGEPAVRLTGTLAADASGVRFGGFPPGTWTVWIDLQHTRHAPVVVRGVAFGLGETDLGVVGLAEGGRFTLEVLVKPGESPPRHSVWVTRVGEPSYTRSADGSAREVVVHGLVPGRYRVDASSYSGRGAFLHEEFDSDGRAEVRRTVDLTR